MGLPQSTERRHYDVVIIGSGMGALTVASLLAQTRRLRVLVLEQHFKAGGYTHTFRRGRFHWDVGLHYIGQMQQGEVLYKLMSFVTNRAVQWTKMPDPFEVFNYPDFRFELHSGADRFVTDLTRRFPKERRAIRQYVHDIRRGLRGHFAQAVRRNRPGWFIDWVAAWHEWRSPCTTEVTTKQYLDAHFVSAELKAILASQWIDYGVPPEQSPFLAHAVVAAHFLDGGYYPAGGAGEIAKAVLPIIRGAGGDILVARRVTQVLTANGRAAGVVVQRASSKSEADGEYQEFYAPVVISNAGTALTYLKLLPADVKWSGRDRLCEFLNRVAPTTSITGYFGFAADLKRIGIHGENRWCFASLDHDDMYRKRGELATDGRATHALVSFPSLKCAPNTPPTAEVVTTADYESFRDWERHGWRRRGDDYEALKERILDGILKLVEPYCPGFSKMVEYSEIATPLTYEHFTQHWMGAVYGLSLSAERYRPDNDEWNGVRTPLPGLYQTGADQFICGICGAMLGGMLTAAAVPGGIGLGELFTRWLR